MSALPPSKQEGGKGLKHSDIFYFILSENWSMPTETIAIKPTLKTLENF